MQLIITTGCSSKKTATPAPDLQARNLDVGSGVDVAEQWKARCIAAKLRIPATNLYAGRAFCISKALARRTNSELLIVSAGFGIVNFRSELPPYEMTITPGPDCVLARVRIPAHFTPEAWWSMPKASQFNHVPIHTVLRNNPESILVVALTKPYLTMVKDELSNLPGTLLERIRIIATSSLELPSPLLPVTIRYSGRLDDPSLALRGTRFDFVTRASVHFCEMVRHDRRVQSPNEHQARVVRALSTFRQPEHILRAKVSDSILRASLKSLRKRGMGQSLALRHLRDHLGLACSQDRFTNIWSSL